MTADHARIHLALQPIFMDVLEEVVSARRKHGEQRLPHAAPAWRAGSAEQRRSQSDLYREATEQASRSGDLTWEDVLLEEVFEAMAEDDPAARRAELIQVIAMAFSEIEQLNEEIAGPGVCIHCSKQTTAAHQFFHGKRVHVETGSRWCSPYHKHGTLAAVNPGLDS